MKDLREIARKIAVLQKYSHDTGVRTSKSQSELLRDLTSAETVSVLEMAIAAEKEMIGGAR